MRKTLLLTAIPSLILCSSLSAQVSAILYTGRFPFVSLAAPNERPGGAISQITEFDFGVSVPLPGGFPAAPMLTAANMHCYLGDGNGDGSYLKFDGWKPSYFTNIGIDGLFVKDVDRANATFDKVFWTPRLDAGFTMEVLTNNGTPVDIVEGDWVRFLPNGNAEFFMTQAQLQVAVGVQAGANTIGAGALVQSATGDLYYTPVDGGHWVNGNLTPPVFAQDGAILKIDASNITYDANGNVAAFAPDSARLLINENTGGGVSTLTVRTMVDNSGAFDRFGAALQTSGTYGKTGGLAFDPNGGTWTPSYADATGAAPAEPNLIFCSNAGSYAGTIWSTNNQGEIATINGVLCGSNTLGLPADGSWLGVELDTSNFQPTLLGMTLIELPEQPLVADINDFGSIADNATMPVIEIDFYGAGGRIVLGLVDLGPTSPDPVVASLPTSIVPLGFDPGTWPDLFLLGSPVSLGFDVSDAFGFSTITVPNPNNGAFAGFTFTVQGVSLAPAGLKVSSPLILQLQ